MLVSSIYDQVAEVTGLCDQTLNLQRLSRAVELLANSGLFDPLIGYLDFNNNDTNLVTLPREVKTVLRCNINRQPTFFRNRLFEFTLNGPGNNDGDEVGFAWHDRGDLPIQEERRLPGKLAYVCTKTTDVGKSIIIRGGDVDGNEIEETLTAKVLASATFGTKEFHKVTQVIRDQTDDVCLLYCVGTATNQLVAQYYPDETLPTYRVIKLSKKVSNVRIMFRREVFEITSLNDVIPLHSKMAVIHATKAVCAYANDEYDKGDACLARAIKFIKDEQASRDEADAIAASLEIAPMGNYTINVRDSIVVADLYDVACDIFGFIGQPKIFDKITTAIEALRNKAHWDSCLGIVDVWTTWNTSTGDLFVPVARESYANPREGKGTGHFVLPRFVESVVSLNYLNAPAIARNRWFEFHPNGTGETNVASRGTWDDAGEVCVLRPFPLDPVTKKTIATKLVALPEDPADNGKEVCIFGVERLPDGREVEVYRNGQPGFRVPCVHNAYDPGERSPAWVRIDRIKRACTNGFVRLTQTNGTVPGSEYGFWYPDEIEPKYRAIRTPFANCQRIRILYRIRSPKVSSLFQPIPLRSRLAIENMMRALKAQAIGDINSAMAFEQMAVGYLSEERINSTPSDAGTLAFDDTTMPGFTGNIT